MSQPHFKVDEVEAMSDVDLADALEDWAKAREHLSRTRMAKGKDALDAKLLREAANRLRHIGENLGGRS